jgi:hypothetical protein
MIKKFMDLYKKNGTCLIEHKQVPFTDGQLSSLEQMCEDVPKEFVEIGDAGEENYLSVGRFQTDIDRPKLVNKKFSNIVMPILENKSLMSFIKEVIDINKKLFVRRVQFNEIGKDCFICYHLDVDSNPDYLAACVIQFGTGYEGGAYRVYKPDSKDKFIDYRCDRYSLIISNCLYPHEVTKVTAGSRKSLVFFISDHFKKNRRLLEN